MPYTLLTGRFVIRYPDIPRQGPEPDGDTVKFSPDTPALVNSLPRPSGRPPEINARGISVRLEAIDALETHFNETHQDLGGANRARDALLARLGFHDVVFFDDLPNKVESADADSVGGYVLSNGVDANGRMIGFVYAGAAPGPDGSSVFLDDPGVDGSVNTQLLADGLVYPAYYGTLPATLRLHLVETSRAARAAGTGIWAASTADPDGPATVTDAQSLTTLTIWPKLFRRLVPYFAAGHTDLDGFDAWLRQDAVHRDDRLVLLDPVEPGNLHDVIVASGHSVQLTRWPEDFVIEPDPAPSGATTKPSVSTAGDVAIVALLPDPTGTDVPHETVTLVNTTAATITLDDWTLADSANRREKLSGSLAAGEAIRVTLSSAARLSNTGGSLVLASADGAVIDTFQYVKSQVKAGRTIAAAH